jgi:endonuclease YncB( thermonuclease family)
MNDFRKIKSVSVLLALLFVFPAVAIAAQYQVVRVVDGDTIVIMYNGKYEKVRLLCVNTPEFVHPDEKQNIPMGKVASWLPDTRKRKFSMNMANMLTLNLKWAE